MKIWTDRKILVRLTNIDFSGRAFDRLLELSLIAPNLRLEAVEFHTGRTMPVRLCTLDFDWAKTNAVNI